MLMSMISPWVGCIEIVDIECVLQFFLSDNATVCFGSCHSIPILVNRLLLYLHFFRGGGDVQKTSVSNKILCKTIRQLNLIVSEQIVKWGYTLMTISS